MKYLILMLLSVNILYAEPEYRVAIFGTNYSQEESSKGFEDPLLAKTFSAIKEKRPNAVFFSGDMLTGLENSETVSIENFQKQLDMFTKVKNTYLGENVPFYPILGNHLPTSFEIIETFRQEFNIQKIAPRPSYHLAYSVPIDGAEFIVLATGFDEPNPQLDLSKNPILPMLNWLEKHLEINSDVFKYRFVIGHFPAFSSTGVSGNFSGLDKNVYSRDFFWSMLRKNHVNAYISSYEPLYDRSNRDGIWQIISGGFVEPGYGRTAGKTFSHFLLLIWGGDNEYPMLKVYDLDGKEWDSFRVIPLNFPVHQMRISEKY
jgi:hypothetical protein